MTNALKNPLSPANVATAPKGEAKSSGMTVLKGPFPEYTSFMTPGGVSYSFYRGYLETDNQDVIEAALKINGVARTDETEFPRPPVRTRSRSASSWNMVPEATVISPQELMQRAVAASNTVPQAAQSTSVPVAPSTK